MARPRVKIEVVETRQMRQRRIMLDLKVNRAAYTFRYALQSPERTLTAGDIDGFREAYIAELAKHDIALR